MEVDSLSIKDLKALIASAGLSFADCLDKSDLKNRAREAQKILDASPQSSQPSTKSGATSTRTFGGYECVVHAPDQVGEGNAADLVVIMLHGLGATSSDFANSNTELSKFESSLAERRVVWVHPQAPTSPIGNAWWVIDVMGFMQGLMNPNDVSFAVFQPYSPPPYLPSKALMTTGMASRSNMWRK